MRRQGNSTAHPHVVCSGRIRVRQDMGALTPVASECGSGRFIKTAGRRKEVDWIWKVMAMH